VRWKLTARLSSRWISSAAFDVHLGVDLLVGRGDRHVLTQRHGERPGQQAGDAAERDGLGIAGGRDTGDQGGIATQAVHGAEGGRPQPASADIGMGVPDVVRRVGLLRRGI
jgi:hypothetical protein